jgi:lipoate-protein ligase A
VGFQELKEALKRGFEEAFKIELVPGEVTGFEEELAEKLRHEKYSTAGWNFRR